MRILIAALCLGLAGCASTSGAIRTGPDTFTVNARASNGAGGSSAAKRNAYADATQECARQGKTVQTLSEQASAPSWTDGMYSIDVTFKCS